MWQMAGELQRELVAVNVAYDNGRRAGATQPHGWKIGSACG